MYSASLSIVLTCLLYTPLGPGHPWCASGHALTYHRARVSTWWNAVLSQAQIIPRSSSGIDTGGHQYNSDKHPGSERLPSKHSTSPPIEINPLWLEALDQFGSLVPRFYLPKICCQDKKGSFTLLLHLLSLSRSPLRQRKRAHHKNKNPQAAVAAVAEGLVIFAPIASTYIQPGLGIVFHDSAQGGPDCLSPHKG